MFLFLCGSCKILWLANRSRISIFRNCRHYSTVRKPQVDLDASVTDGSNFKRHPGIRNLKNIRLPEKIENAVGAILEQRNLPELLEEARKLSNYLHSRKIPIEANAMKIKRTQYFDEVMNQMPAINENSSEDEKVLIKKTIMGKVNAMIRSRVYHWKPIIMSDTTSYHYLAARGAAEYAAVTRVFNEIVQQDPEFAPKFLFDFGSGVGTVSWAANEFWSKTLKEHFTVDVSAEANELARLILQLNDPEKQPFVKNLLQRQFFPTTPTKYDLVVSAYSLIELDSSRTRFETIRNLWAKTDKYLVLIEQGTNAGFQLIEEARDIILNTAKGGHVFAPCPHDLTCPRMKENSQTPCNFPVPYTNLKKFYKASQSRELISFVILKKGARSANDAQWPRIVRESLQRHNHSICRLCTGSGDLKEIILTASKHGKPVYKCARRSEWGDLIPVSLKYDSE